MKQYILVEYGNPPTTRGAEVIKIHFDDTLTVKDDTGRTYQVRPLPRHYEEVIR